MTVDEMIAVLQAAKDGAEIQIKSKMLNQWRDIRSPMWNFYLADYRVKPAPQEVLLAVNKNSGIVSRKHYPHGFSGGSNDYSEIVWKKFREVVEDE